VSFAVMPPSLWVERATPTRPQPTVRSGWWPAASAAPAGAPGSVDFWQWGTGYVPGFDTLVKAYNDAGPKGKVGASNPSDYWNKVVTSEAGGAGPDVFLMNNVNFKQWSLTQNVTDLSSYLGVDKAASASLAAMLQSAVDWYHYKGKLMGVPWDYSTGVLIYNTELLKTVNLSSPADAGKSWDWNMLRDYATKLTQKSGSNITRSGVWINNGLENGWYTFSLANGGPFGIRIGAHAPCACGGGRHQPDRERMPAQSRIRDTGAAVFDPVRPLDNQRERYIECGTSLPVAQQRADDVDGLAGPSQRLRIRDAVLGLEAFPTPGHASHHVSYLDRDGTLYAGDTAGVRIQPSRYVMPPTPPPDIDVAAWEHTIDEIERRSPDRLALVHFGVVDDDVRGHLTSLRLELVSTLTGI